jgi:hypothetical protein
LRDSKAMKVLFLDFDGVLNSIQSRVFWENLKDQDQWEKDMQVSSGGILEQIAMEFCPIAISNLEELIRRTKIKIVVSSSWRVQRTVQELGELFKSKLISEAIIDKTESFSNTRGDEIQKWLDEHPEVENYVILDDDQSMLESQQKKFIKTSPLHGFQYGDVLWAERILK